MDKSYESAITHINEAIKNNKLVIFVGAGISINSGYLSWENLIGVFKEELGLDDKDRDNLKIAQLYYNTWGGKQYYSLLDKVFNEKYYEPNPLHEEIFKLNPHHIITTNYDCLLEDEMVKQNKKYHIVKKDRDLAYDNKDKLIIKMHGDLSERNIVLKEDDYTNYSRNYELIELYIKSLLINHTFLFVGYSLQDSNFKMIFNSIKSQLNEDFQRAIFFDSSNNISEIEVNYYRNKGINIVINNEKEELLPKNFDNIRGNRVLKFIRDINYHTKNEKRLINSTKNEIKEYLNFLVQLPLIDPILIIKNEYFEDFYYNASSREIYSNKPVPLQETDAEIEGLLRIMQVEKFSNIKVKNDIKEYKTDFKRLDDAYKKFIEFDFNKAVELFKIESNYFFKRKNYFMTLICEFNINILNGTLYKKSEKETDSNGFIGGYDSIDAMISDFKNSSDEEQATLIRTFEPVFNHSYFNSVYYNINQSMQKIQNNKSLINNGGFTTSNEVEQLINTFKNFHHFIQENKLCLTHFKKYREISKIFISGILASISTNNMGYFFGDLEIINKKNELDLFDIKIIMNSINSSNFDKLMKIHGINKINISKDGLVYIFDCILNQLIKDSINIYEINKLNIGYKLLKVSNSICSDKLIDILKFYVNKKVLRHDYLEDLLIVINNNFKNIDEENMVEMCMLIEKVAAYLVEELIKDGYDNFYDKSLRILRNIWHLNADNGMNLKIDSINFHEKLLLFNYDDEVHKRIIRYKEIIVYLNSYFDDNTKEEIKKIINKMEIEIENMTKIDNQLIRFILELQDSNVFTFNTMTIQKVNKNIVSEIEKLINENNKIKIAPDPIKERLYELYYIYNNISKIRNIKKFLNANKVELAGKSPEVDWEIYNLKTDKVIEDLIKDYSDVQNVLELFGKTKNNRDIIYNYIYRKYIESH